MGSGQRVVITVGNTQRVSNAGVYTHAGSTQPLQRPRQLQCDRTEPEHARHIRLRPFNGHLALVWLRESSLPRWAASPEYVIRGTLFSLCPWHLQS